MRGFYIAPDVWVSSTGMVYVKNLAPPGSLGEVVQDKWMQWGQLGSGILDKILTYKLQSKQVSYGQYPMGGGLPVGAGGLNYTATGPGMFGSINPVYLLLAAGLGMFLLMRK